MKELTSKKNMIKEKNNNCDKPNRKLPTIMLCLVPITLVAGIVPVFLEDRKEDVPMSLSLPESQSHIQETKTDTLQVSGSETIHSDSGLSLEVDPVPTPTPTPVRVERSLSVSRNNNRTIEQTVEAPIETPIETPKKREVINNPIPPTVEGNAILEIASNYVGVPYVYGGTNPDVGLDCSGFTQLVYSQVGISLPRSSKDQGNMGTTVSYSDALPGDLIWSPGHIAIYAGDGMQIDAPKPGETIQFRKIWQKNPVFIRL